MIIVPEEACPGLLSLDDAFPAVEQIFAAMARGDAYNFPVVREAIGHADALYGFKGGFDRAGKVLGVKAGGYWPHNLERNLGGNHQSTVFLFDPDTGKATACVGGNYLTAARTAASAAVSIKHLARQDAKVLGMVGAGHQSAFQMRAAARQRAFEKVIGWNFHPEMLSRLADTAAELGLPFESVDLDRLGAEADVIITITSSFDFRMDEWGVDVAVTGSQKGFMLPAGLAIVGVSPKALAAMETAKLPRTFLDFRDMLATNPKGGYPYTPPVQLLYGLGESLKMLQEEGLDNVFARHHRLAEGIRRAIAAWGMKPCAQSPDLYSETVTAVVVPEGFDGTKVVVHAADKYGVAFGVGLGEVAGKVFRIGHLGSLTDVMALSGLACAEMVMADLNFPITLGSGVAAAQEYYRNNAAALEKAA